MVSYIAFDLTVCTANAYSNYSLVLRPPLLYQLLCNLKKTLLLSFLHHSAKIATLPLNLFLSTHSVYMYLSAERTWQLILRRHRLIK